MKIKAKLTSGEVFEIAPVEETMTILRLKEIISSRTGEQLETMRLIWKGKIFQEDELSLSDYALEDNALVNVAKVRTSLVSPTRPGLLVEQEDPMDKYLDNPAVKSLMNNPAFLENMIYNNPTIKKQIEKNPALKESLSNPEVLKQMAESLANPSRKKEMMRGIDRSLQHIESMPGGMSMIQSMYKSMENSEVGEPDPSTEEANAHMARMLGANLKSKGEGPNTESLPNPWAPPPLKSRMVPITSPVSSSSSSAASPFGFGFPSHQQYPAAFNQFNGFLPPGGVPIRIAPTPTAVVQPPDILYRGQLDSLREMGFTDLELNKRAIVHSKGDLATAIDYLAEHM